MFTIRIWMAWMAWLWMRRFPFRKTSIKKTCDLEPPSSYRFIVTNVAVYILYIYILPSGKLTVCYGKWPILVRWFTYSKWWFSIVMLVDQTVYTCDILILGTGSDPHEFFRSLNPGVQRALHGSPRGGNACFEGHQGDGSTKNGSLKTSTICLVGGLEHLDSWELWIKNIFQMDIMGYLAMNIWLVVWNHGILWSSIYWECHHPNWRTHIFQRGRSTTNQL